MTTAALKNPQVFGPYAAGARLTPREFDRADFVPGWRYELINGVLVVTPIPLEKERDPNEELGHWLRNYRELLGAKSPLDVTLPEHTVKTGSNRRRADRAIWVGYGHLPRHGESPTIIVEFVSSGKRDRQRDYQEKRDEYLTIGVKEYWVIDRFQRTMTVFSKKASKIRKRMIREDQIYVTPLLPGFELALARLLAVADAWNEIPDDADFPS